MKDSLSWLYFSSLDSNGQIDPVRVWTRIESLRESIDRCLTTQLAK